MTPNEKAHAESLRGSGALDQRVRPGQAEEEKARAAVMEVWPKASSAYTSDGAVIFTESPRRELGRSTARDWAVEWAWVDAKNKLPA